MSQMSFELEGAEVPLMTTSAPGVKVSAATARANVRWAGIREDLEWMAQTGETRENASKRLGISWEHLDREFARRHWPFPVFRGDYAYMARREAYAAM